MSTTNWSSQAGMGDGDTGEVTTGSTTIDTNWTQSSGMTDVSGEEQENIVELVERAETAATNAETAETNAETAEVNAETAQTAAETAKTGAETAQTAAETAQTAAEAAQTAAETAETNAEMAYSNTLAIYGDTTDVQTAVDSASTSATNAATSATAASTSATNASTSATAAANSATAAATSATSSASSASTSNTSALAAQTAESNAETAEANAISARLAAESAESNAEASATQAANSATSASSSASQALSSKNAAASSESAAATSAYNAGVSETNASTSEANAATSESNAASSATAAASSASSAASSATDAETAQTAAESAQASAEAVYDSFDDRYLGSKSSDPTLDNDGDALTTGALYFNSIENEIRVYTGSAWEPIQELSGDQTVNSLTSNNDVVVKGNLEVQGTTITVDSATAQTIDLGDNDKIRLGDGDDLQIYHDGSNSIIRDFGTGNLELRAANFKVTNAAGSENMILGLPNGSVSLYHDNNAKLATTSSGVDITGNITVSGTVDGRDIAADGATLDTALQNVSEDTTPQLGGALDTNGNNIDFGDSTGATVNRLRLGDGYDLHIYHDGTHSYVRDQGFGNLILQGSGAIKLQSTAGEDMIIAYANDATELYYDNSKKLATTSSGVDVTGTLVSDGLTVDGDVTLTNSTSGNHLVYIDSTTGNSRLVFSRDGTDRWNIGYSTSGAVFNIYDSVAGATRLAVEDNGDILFYEDTGTTPKLTWDASDERLKFSDSVEARFGDNSEFRIYHDTSDTYLVNFTQGNIYLKQEVNDKDVVIQSDDGSGGSTNYFVADGSTGEAKLFHYGSEKLATKSTGIDVTGTVKADAITSNGNLTQINASTSGNLLRFQDSVWQGAIYHDSGNIYLRSGGSTSSQNRLRIKGGGDVVLYSDDATSEDFYWDASTSRLGLGTTSPSTAIHAESNTAQSGRSIRLAYDGSFYTEIASRASGGVSYNAINPTAGGHRFEIDSTEKMRLDNQGRLGIGTTGPSNKLHVSSSDELVAKFESTDATVGFDLADNTAYTRITSTAGDFRIDANDDGSGENSNIQFAISGSEAMRINSSGNVGIGTTSPSEVLELRGSTNAQIRMQPSATGESGFINTTSGSTKGMVQYNHNSNFMRIYTNGSEAMRIDSSGRLGIGTTSPAQLLHLQGADAGLILDDTDGTSTHQQTWLKSDNGNFRLQTRNSSNTFVSNDYLVQKGASGATSHQWRIDNSEAMRIDSSGNVGIGTTSPSTTLDLTSSTNGHGLKIRQGNAGSGYHSAINFEGSNGSGGYVAVASIKAYQETNGVNGSLRFYTDTTGTERMRIDSSGNVGIGTTAPSGNLDITTSGLVSLDIQGGDGNSKNIIFRKTTGGIQQAKISAVGDDLRFTTGTTSERMRIDSNGNLLVGTTDQVAHVGSSTGEGIALSAGSYGGFIGASRSDNVVTVLNRQTSDGNIVQFRKDGNTVGSIGVDNTDNLVIEGNSTHSGLQFGTNALLPHKSGVVVDNTLTLGSTTARWANMYLAGGVYLGGTATANRLDDYEEGTWTPQAGRLTGGTISATYSVQEGTYTKIGNLVYVTCYVVIDSITSQGSSYTTIEGLPFTSSGSNYTHLLSSSGNAINTTDVITQGFPSGTRMLFGYDRNTNFPPIANDWQAGLIRISGCYRA